MGAFLSKQARQALVSSQLDDKKDMSVQELKQYVQRFPQIMSVKKALSQHTAIAELIKEVTDSHEFLDNLQVSTFFYSILIDLFQFVMLL